MRNRAQTNILSADFVTTHYVDEEFHKLHPQLIHKHQDDMELLYIIEGEGKYFVNGREYQVRQGNLIICNANVLHGEPPLKDNHMISYCCVLSNYHPEGTDANTIPGSENHPLLYFDEDRSVIESLYSALMECENKAPYSANAALKQLLGNALLETVILKLRSHKPVKQNVKQKNDIFAKTILEYLNNHYEENITLADLEAVFKVSRYTISHIFKSETGLSPMKYVLQRKIGEAQNLLMNTQTPIGDISECLGFNNNCHFSSSFKKYVGVTPTQYRIRFTDQTT